MSPMMSYNTKTATAAFDAVDLDHSDVNAVDNEIDSIQSPKSLNHNRRSPTLGGIRRIMKRTHTPEGLVLYYESRLRRFLGITESSEHTVPETNEGLGDEDWQVIEQEEGVFSPFDKDFVFDEDDLVVLNKALARLLRRE
ncbi:hypothetical protein GGI07_001943 [Coemansia sp. Benny D115]|nr:hypothetical protein GGI07_001943 [Coemansia sp. Benny D115]